MSKRIIKQARHTEQYQREKLHRSVQAACRSVHDFIGAAEDTAEHVCRHVDGWLEDKIEVTSADIKRIAAGALRNYNPHAALIYETHTDVN